MVDLWPRDESITVPLRNPLRCAPLVFYLLMFLAFILLGSLTEDVKITFTSEQLWTMFLTALVIYLLCCMGYNSIAWFFALLPFILLGLGLFIIALSSLFKR